MLPSASDDAVPTPIHDEPRPLWHPPLGKLAEGTVPVAIVRANRLPVALIAAIVATAAAAIVAYALYSRAAKREALEQKFPVAADGAAAHIIEREATRWADGEPRLARALAGFQPPPLASLVGSGACAFDGTGSTFTAGPGLLAEVRAYVWSAIDAARRGRFASAAAEHELVQQLTGPVIVVSAGVSYAFDPATGALRCAGSDGLRAVEE